VVGTVNDVKTLTRLAHDAGAKVFLDAVHYAPHGPIDVQDWGCDFLACSAYKFFGPHVGILWGRRELLETLPAYKVKPASEELPGRWMTGTQNHEGLAGVLAAVEYLASLGSGTTRRQRLQSAMTAIRRYEASLAERLLAGLAARSRFKVWGITQRDRLAWRVPTISVTCADRTPDELTEHLARHEFYTWNGNLYALELADRLGLEQRGGFVRLGLVHYNTPAEIDRLLGVLDAA
jgi:selenocysteine lyase/cysteine desulfurase